MLSVLQTLVVGLFLGTSLLFAEGDNTLQPYSPPPSSSDAEGFDVKALLLELEDVELNNNGELQKYEAAKKAILKHLPRADQHTGGIIDRVWKQKGPTSNEILSRPVLSAVFERAPISSLVKLRDSIQPTDSSRSFVVGEIVKSCLRDLAHFPSTKWLATGSLASLATNAIMFVTFSESHGFYFEKAVPIGLAAGLTMQGIGFAIDRMKDSMRRRIVLTRINDVLQDSIKHGYSLDGDIAKRLAGSRLCSETIAKLTRPN